MSRANALANVSSFGSKSLIIGVVALLVTLGYSLVDSTQFFRSYLFGFIYSLAFGLGALPLLALHHLIEGRWGFSIRRLLEAGVKTIPVFLVLGLPILIGMTTLYPWARPEAVSNPLLQAKALYLNANFFILRYFIYFALWIGCGYYLTTISAADDKSPDPAKVTRMRHASGPIILIYAFSLTFAAIDWVMSLEPGWFSTIFGLIFMIGQALTVFAVSACVLVSISKKPPLSDAIRNSDFHDLGNLLLAFTTIWAYLSFSQYLIIWSGNLPEEAVWFESRVGEAWKWMSILLVVFHFAVPFMILLQRRAKKNTRFLTKIAIGLLVMRFIDIYWYVVPSFHPESAMIHWLDLVAAAGLVGVWFGLYTKQLAKAPLLAVGDWRVQGNDGLREALSHE